MPARPIVIVPPSAGCFLFISLTARWLNLSVGLRVGVSARQGGMVAEHRTEFKEFLYSLCGHDVGTFSFVVLVNSYMNVFVHFQTRLYLAICLVCLDFYHIIHNSILH